MNGTGTPLRLVVLGASGGVGRRLLDEGLRRSHDVHAIVRDPRRFDHAPDPQLTLHRGDVHEPASIAAAMTPDSVVLSGLGVRNKKEAGVLTAGARAVIAVIYSGPLNDEAAIPYASEALASVRHRFFPALSREPPSPR